MQDDLISRQAVDDAIYDYSRSCDVNYHQIMEFIEKIPSVTPQPKTGHWINRRIIANRSIDMIVCSECGEEFSYDAETGVSEYNYCPNCGARMVEPQESEEV